MIWAARTQWFMQKGRGAVHALGASVAAIAALVARHREFVFALAATVLFYFPALRNASGNAGFLYGGDVIGFVWPTMVKANALISSFNFTAIDFSLLNGSADFFLSPNLLLCHPILVVYSLFTSPQSTSPRDIGHLLVVMLAFHSFVACYFSIKLLTRFFSLEFGGAALCAVVFAFSVLMLNAHGEPMFVICASMVSWSAYGALAFEERPSVRALLLASMPVLITYLGGYLPLGVACLMFAIAAVAAKLLLLDAETRQLPDRVRAFAAAMAPFACATLIVAPYLFSVYLFYADSPSSKSPSLFFSAHMLADLPQSILRLFSPRYEVPGPMYEFSVTWGFIPVVIAALFLLSRRTFDELSAREWRILKIFAVIYFVTVLSIFGQHSAVSDLVFYLVPQVGSMHIYQRFLLPAQLFLGVMIALMLKALVQARPTASLRIALALLLVISTAAAFVVARNPALSKAIGINSYVVFELGLAVLFAFALMVPGKAFAYGAAIVLSSLPALDRMYDYSAEAHGLEAQKKRLGVALDESARARLLSYLKKGSDKTLIKYLDLTPLWNKGIESFPKALPYFVLRELDLSSYNSFGFYLSSRADYMRRMPILGEVQLMPDWELVLNTGADFVVARESDLKSGTLAGRLGELKSEDLFRLPNGIVFASLRNLAGKELIAPSTIFDNGYFRVSPGHASDDRPKPELENIALNKMARQSSTLGKAEAKLVVDGNTSGDFEEESVSHTAQDVNAWFEIDLGSVESIDSVRVWNRTDCCGFRLNDYWLFISATPFADADTAATLRARPDTWRRINSTPDPSRTIDTPGVRGRYVRIQLEGAKTGEQSFLSLAEVQVFRAEAAKAAPAVVEKAGGGPTVKVLNFTTNHANHIRLDLESTGPASVSYLLWNNPRLHYFLNGERATVGERDGLAVIDIPAGRNSIEIRYRHWPLVTFWLVYALFGAAYVWALVATALLSRRNNADA